MLCGISAFVLNEPPCLSGEAALVAAVLRTAANQETLLPALMRTYVSADFVVGLDVDKDSFDKFSMRRWAMAPWGSAAAPVQQPEGPSLHGAIRRPGCGRRQR